MLPLISFETGRKTQTQSSVKDHSLVRDSKWKSGSIPIGTAAERPTHATRNHSTPRSSQARQESPCPLDKDPSWKDLGAWLSILEPRRWTGNDWRRCTMQTSDVQESRLPLGGVVWDMALNAIVPVILYKLSKRYLSPSELTALLIAGTFPLGKSIFDLVRRGQADPISIVILLGIAANGVALCLGGSPRLLLVRESLFTGAFGFACFFSLLLPRPMMFYFARYFIAGADPQRQFRFNAAWRLHDVRFCHRLITSVWGCVFVGELILRIVLIYNAPASIVLIVSPILLGTLAIAAMIWAFSYGHRVRLRALAQLNPVTSPGAQ